MLLVIDVGNTNITLGVFNKDELFGTFRMKTKQREHRMNMELLYRTGRKTRDRKLEDQCSDPCIRSAGCDAFTRQCDYQIFRRKAGGCICRN